MRWASCLRQLGRAVQTLTPRCCASRLLLWHEWRPQYCCRSSMNHHSLPGPRLTSALCLPIGQREGHVVAGVTHHAPLLVGVVVFYTTWSFLMSVIWHGAGNVSATAKRCDYRPESTESDQVYSAMSRSLTDIRSHGASFILFICRGNSTAKHKYLRWNFKNTVNNRPNP